MGSTTYIKMGSTTYYSPAGPVVESRALRTRLLIVEDHAASSRVPPQIIMARGGHHRKGESKLMNFTQKISRFISGAAIQVLTLALFLGVFGAGVALAQTNAYVTNSTDNTVSVIDSSTNTVTATIPVGSTPRGIAVTPNSAVAYVANALSNNVSVIDTASNTV